MAVLMVCMMALAGFGRDVYKYRKRTGSLESVNTWTRDAANGGRIELTAEKTATGEFDRMICDSDYHTIEWFYTNRIRSTSLHAVRENGSIRISGEIRGKPVDKTIRLKTIDWYQFAEFAISRMLAAHGNSATYSLFWPDKMEFYVMKAARSGNEKITIGGKEIDTVRVKVTLSGFLSVFWSSEYWFRASDFLFVKYKGVNGPPGTAPTIIELVQ